MNVTGTLFSMMAASGGDASLGQGQESEAHSFASVFALADTDSSVDAAEAGRIVREIGAIRLTSTEVQGGNSVLGGENRRPGTRTGISLLHGDRTTSPLVVVDTAELIWIGEVQPDQVSTPAVTSTATRDNGNSPILLLELVTLVHETDGDIVRDTAERLAKALENVLADYVPSRDGSAGVVAGKPEGGTSQATPMVVAVRVTSFETARESMVTEPPVATPVISGLRSTGSDSEHSSRVVTPVAPLLDEPAVEGLGTQPPESNHLRGSARQTNGRHSAPAPRTLDPTPSPPGVAPTLASAEETNDRLNDRDVVARTEGSIRTAVSSGISGRD